jgi:2-oxoglutarate dehydrogenase E2 component (dihydrolipoamide succinyltransferase)
MKVEVLLPSMGESVLEATVTNWLKEVGDTIEVDENIVEVATDKVDTEVPSPVAGKLVEITVKENEIAKVDGVICFIEVEGEIDPPVSPEKEEKKEKPKVSKSAKLNVFLPSMGESVLEATLTNWLVSVGDTVNIDDNLCEVSTDKVDTEVPSPYAGKIVEILVQENEIAKVDGIICVIEGKGIEAPAEASPEPVKIEEKTIAPKKVESDPIQNIDGRFYTPLVKRIAKIENITESELSTIKGSGKNGRVNKDDLTNFLKNRGSAPDVKQTTSSPQTSISPVNVTYDENRVTVTPMSTMRKGIAKHMVQSMYTAPHVFSIHEVNMKRIWDFRNSVKVQFKKKYGFNLTFTHIIMEMVAKAIRKHPRINASISGNDIIIRHDVNLGMAVGFKAKDGDNGLIVPVIKHSDELNLVGISRKATEMTDKARDSKIMPDDTAGGTFTVTNVGTFGTEVGLGIINQPQVAILALGTIVKKPIVTKDDAIMVAPMMKMALSYDHRVVDGMLAGEFLHTLQNLLENYQDDDSLV